MLRLIKIDSFLNIFRSETSYLYAHAWMVQLRHVLSGDQNEVFESLVDFQRLISWNPTVKRFFLFQHLTFYGLINLYTKSFSLLEEAEIPP